MIFNIGDAVIVKETGQLGEIKKIRPNELREYSVRIIEDNIWIRYFEYELELYKQEPIKTVIDLKENSTVNIEILPKRKRKNINSFMDKIEYKDE